MEQLRTFGVQATSIEADLSQPKAPFELYQAVVSAMGEPNILINNACCDITAPFTELTPDLLDRHYAVNTLSVAMLCREFVKTSHSGTIINMTSGQSLGSMGSDKVPYTITKAGLEMLVKQLAPELTKQGITIYALDPGPTDTGWMSEAIKAEAAKHSTLGRVVTPVDIADLIVNLIATHSEPADAVIHAYR